MSPCRVAMRRSVTLGSSCKYSSSGPFVQGASLPSSTRMISWRSSGGVRSSTDVIERSSGDLTPNHAHVAVSACIVPVLDHPDPAPAMADTDTAKTPGPRQEPNHLDRHGAREGVGGKIIIIKPTYSGSLKNTNTTLAGGSCPGYALVRQPGWRTSGTGRLSGRLLLRARLKQTGSWARCFCSSLRRGERARLSRRLGVRWTEGAWVAGAGDRHSYVSSSTDTYGVGTQPGVLTVSVVARAARVPHGVGGGSATKRRHSGLWIAGRSTPTNPTDCDTDCTVQLKLRSLTPSAKAPNCPPWSLPGPGSPPPVLRIVGSRSTKPSAWMIRKVSRVFAPSPGPLPKCGRSPPPLLAVSWPGWSWTAANAAIMSSSACPGRNGAEWRGKSGVSVDIVHKPNGRGKQSEESNIRIRTAPMDARPGRLRESSPATFRPSEAPG